MNIDQTLSLEGHQCPMNFVYTKLKLEEMRHGEVLEVFVSPGEPARNVPRSVVAEGHKLLEEGLDEERYRLVIQKVGE